MCPDCQTWRFLRRSMIFPHRAADGRTRCVGSGQRVCIDLPLAALAARQDAERAQAGQRRATRVQLKPSAPVPPRPSRSRPTPPDDAPLQSAPVPGAGCFVMPAHRMEIR